MEFTLESLSLRPDVASAAVALAVGLLIGLAAEALADQEKTNIGGVRTFTLIALGGCLSVLWGEGVFVFLTGAVILGLLIAAQMLTDKVDGGTMAIPVAALVTWLLGGGAARGENQTVMMVGATVAFLLSARTSLHGFVRRFLGGPELFRAALFALMLLVIFPILPDRELTPLRINPYQIWRMVLLISAISFVGFFVMRIWGARAGLWMTAIFGGLASSTAVTVSFAAMSKKRPELESQLAGGIILASAIMFLRQGVLVAFFAPPELVGAVAAAVLPAFFVGLFFCAKHLRKKVPVDVVLENPLELSTAVKFGLLFAVVQVALRYGADWFGEAGLAVVALFSGITDVDAITLATANLTADSAVTVSMGALVVLLAGVSNTIAKGVITKVTGDKRAFKHVLVAFAGMAGALTAGYLIYLVVKS